jgi:two-component system, CAI-1 autoinducer sensor kinase/phosphatase CqsS
MISHVLQAIANALRAPLEPILHASTLRLQSLGLFVFLGQLVFGWIWLYVFPQPYENMNLRFVAACLGLFLIWDRISERPDSEATEWVFALIMWIELPVLFMVLYFMNTTSIVWFGSVLVMLLVYYQLTDWRLATLGIVGAAFISYGIASFNFASKPIIFDLISARGAMLLFALTSALELSISSANLRRKRLENSLTTMGIIAHELRTPLATLSLLGDGLRVAAGNKNVAIDHCQIDSIVTRIYALSRAMNRQIDMQIANSSLLHLSPSKEELSAGMVVHSAMTQFPFKTQHEKEIIQVSVVSDFEFLGSQHLFEQVILNLVKNAYHALAVTQKSLEHADIRIDVTAAKAKGFIKVFDRGIGFDSASGTKIFEPFFSTQSDTGHGLGLAFCRAVVHAAGGKISASSDSETGTCFTIVLPIYQPKKSWTGFQL